MAPDRSGPLVEPSVQAAHDATLAAEQFLLVRQLLGGGHRDAALQTYLDGWFDRLAAVHPQGGTGELAVVNDARPLAVSLPGGRLILSAGLLRLVDGEAELVALLAHHLVHALSPQQQVTAVDRGARPPLPEPGAYVIGSARHALEQVPWRYSDQAEWEADRGAVELLERAGQPAHGLIDLGRRLGRYEGARLHASHVASAERLEALHTLLGDRPSRHRSTNESFLAAMAVLRETRAASDAAKAARRALASGQVEAAMQLAERALQIAPEQGVMHGLAGDVAFAAGDHAAAIDHYSAALARQSDHFRHYLGRGEARRRAGEFEAARTDLIASMRRLPTADAALALARIAELRDEQADAVLLYDAASTSRTPAGREALRRLLVLDLPQRPDRYLSAQVKVDRAGRLYVDLHNRTALDLHDIRLVLRWRDPGGSHRSAALSHPREIPAGGSGILLLDSAYLPYLESLQSQVTAARLSERT